MELIYKIKDKPPFSKGLTLQFRNVVISPVACALFLGIVVNLLVNIKKPKKEKDE